MPDEARTLYCPGWCVREMPHSEHESAPVGPYYTGAGLVHLTGVETRAGDLYVRALTEGARCEVSAATARSVAAALTFVADQLEGLA